MRVLVHARESGPGWHRQFVQAFRGGFRAHGIEIEVTPEDAPDNDALNVLFGPNYFPRTFGKADRKLTVNRCFFGNEKENVAIGYNGFNGFADFRNEGKQADRFWKKQHEFPEIHASESVSNYAILLGEYPSACDRPSMIEQFYRWVKDDADYHGYRLAVRPHPHHVKEILGLPRTKKPLETAARIYTYASTFGVHCALRGLPVVAHPASVAYPYTSGAIDFHQWRCNLAYAQWNISEVHSGEFWEHLKDA